MSKIFEELGNPALSDYFLMITFGTALLFCLSLVRIRKEKLGKWEMFFGLLIGIPNFFSAKFLLGALEHIAAVIVYPVYSVATILVVSLTGVLAFKERLEKRQWIALGIILAAFTALNIGALLALPVMDAMFLAGRYLLQQAGAVLCSTVLINLIVFFFYDHKGIRRATWRELLGKDQ